jgi:hypothetical protein
MKSFLDDLFRSGDSDRIAENPWSSGQGISIDTPQGDDDLFKDFSWDQVKSDF